MTSIDTSVNQCASINKVTDFFSRSRPRPQLAEEIWKRNILLRQKRLNAPLKVRVNHVVVFEIHTYTQLPFQNLKKLKFWKWCQRIRVLPERFSLAISKVGNIKIKRNISLYFLFSFIVILLLSFLYFFLFCIAWRLSLGDGKSKWNIGDLAQIINTVFINPVIYKLHLLKTRACDRALLDSCFQQ